MNANDPVPQKGWFIQALDLIRADKDIGRGTYYRYAPVKDLDELPTDLINHGLLLGRFMYEHLFPVSLESEH